ncbi:MAG: Gfo/Idh/MocA family protein [Thermoguttaceae bacterium]|jgi:predicted dehydrogenase
MLRRDFLKAGAWGFASTGLPSFSEAMTNKTLRAALIGTGWYGKVDLFRLLQVAPVEVTSLCDVYRPRLEEAALLTAARQVSRNTPALYGDWRELLEKEELDLVLIATPDHWHALPTIAAMEKGINVWVQKPIGVDVAECRVMCEVAKRTGVVTQVGLQRRSTPHLVAVKKEFFDTGRLGKIVQVDIFCYYGSGDLKFDAQTPPDGFDYEMWTGPAPMRPYYPLKSNGGWRQFMEYGNGTLGDMGVHMFDMVRWLMGLGWPRRVFSAGGRYVNTSGVQNIPDTQTVIFAYDDLQVNWNHRHWGRMPDPRHPWGAYFHGTEGLLKVSVFGWDFYPKGKTEPESSGEVVYELDEFPDDQNEKRIELHTTPGIRYQMRNFLGGITEGNPTVCPIEEGAVSTASCVLGNLSMTLGRTLEWDPETWTVKNDDEANRLLAREYRSGWEHP